ncbi:MAG: cyclic 2,3-diphosphoglycerate synthase [Methanomassiliicoccales archaeon]|nr:cyclic 2,3-diphosphoglycerate synthase [Methanomassiliicoccales archaeon]MDD1756473.1 cyclic 2,3-diphosphoglycerate synthase [Methanomassiliicoccales archaeon]
MRRCKVIIMGAAGRDFHNFNTFFRDNDRYEVVAFTATQIPNIEERLYPSDLAGKMYPQGIPIHSEDELPELIREHGVEQVIFAYSDISHVELMHKASMVLACGADFRLMGNSRIVLKSIVPVIAVCAVRTGSGKSQTTRKICKILRSQGLRVVAVRHPMPYGDLSLQAIQRYATYDDMDSYDCTIEEREEYEPLIDNGIVVYAGVDYEHILREAEKEADVIVWDGGNNDMSFYAADLYIVMADPHRPGHEMLYHPGEANVRRADVVIINKVQTADRQNILTVKENVAKMNPRAVIIEAASPISVDDPSLIKGKRVLVVEDGPTLTHGEMTYGAGTIAAEDFGAAEIVDPRPFAVGSILAIYAKYKHVKNLLPAMGYSREQIQELEETIRRIDCDTVVAGTPVDLRRVIKVDKPIVRVRYELDEIGHPSLAELITERLGPRLQGRTG